jgi:hypothetical protein
MLMLLLTRDQVNASSVLHCQDMPALNPMRTFRLSSFFQQDRFSLSRVPEPCSRPYRALLPTLSLKSCIACPRAVPTHRAMAQGNEDALHLHLQAACVAVLACQEPTGGNEQTYLSQYGNPMLPWCPYWLQVLADVYPLPLPLAVMPL